MRRTLDVNVLSQLSVAVISPHLDDAVLSWGHAWRKGSQRGRRCSGEALQRSATGVCRSEFLVVGSTPMTAGE